MGGSKEIFRRKILFLKELLPHRIWHSGHYCMILTKNMSSLSTEMNFWTKFGNTGHSDVGGEDKQIQKNHNRKRHVK